MVVRFTWNISQDNDQLNEEWSMELLKYQLSKLIPLGKCLSISLVWGISEYSLHQLNLL